MILVSFFQINVAKSQNCKLCSIPSFPSVTVYQSIQGNGIGFGAEAGTWNKDASRFSYFVGTSMIWMNDKQQNGEKVMSSAKQVQLSFYLKGQYRLASQLYVIAAPGIVDLSTFDLKTGLRYVIPITSIIGIGLEPSYSLNQKQFVFNTNLHFALK